MDCRRGRAGGREWSCSNGHSLEEAILHPEITLSYHMKIWGILVWQMRSLSPGRGHGQGRGQAELDCAWRTSSSQGGASGCAAHCPEGYAVWVAYPVRSGPQQGKGNVKDRWTLGRLQPGWWETQAQTVRLEHGTQAPWPCGQEARAGHLPVTCQHRPTR